jgi:hypothetical protein
MFKRLFGNKRRREAERRLEDQRARVDRFGWTAIYVGDYERSPTWAYTIGFQRSLGLPEVIVFDLPMEFANGIFHEIYNDLKSGGLIIRDGDEWRPGEFEHPIVWRRVHPRRLYDNDPEQPWLALAEDFSKILTPEAGPIEAFQLVASDPAGHLPWEAGYDESLRPRQRALWEPVKLAADASV